MHIKYRNKLSVFLILILNTFALILTQFSTFIVALDKAVENGYVPDAWDYPANDNGFNHTLGTGIKVAIIDTGIDWQHPDFYKPDFSKIYNIGFNGSDYYIDFNNDSTDQPNEFGLLNITRVYKNKTVYTGVGIDVEMDYGFNDSNSNGQYDFNETICYYIDKNNNGTLDINDKAVPLGESKIDIIRDYSSGKNFISGFNLTNSGVNDEIDDDGHGTHIAGIIAAGWPKIRNITGVAPNCTLLIYKVAEWNNDNVSQGIVDAVSDGADVISLSYGEYFRNITLDGSGVAGGGSKVEDVIDWAYDQGVPVVVAAGNYGDKDVHTINIVPFAVLPIGTFSIPFVIPPINSLDVNYLEFLNVWLSPNELIGVNVTIPHPWGGPPVTIPDEYYDPTLPWDGSINPYQPPGLGLISPIMIQRERYNANMNGVNKSYMKIWVEGWQISPGPGTYTLLNLGNNIQRVHSYINSKYDIKGWYSGSPGAYWTNFVEKNNTINSPATANHSITVGSYISTYDPLISGNSLGDISAFSSRGPRVDEVEQMDVIAPGEIILSTASRNVSNPYEFGQGNFTTKRGTSMAAPYVAGIIALAMSNNYNLVGKSDVVEQLIQDSTYTDSFTDTYGVGYNNVTGYGKANASQMLYLSEPPSNPSIIINNGAINTNSTLVDLALSAIGAEEMSFRNGTTGTWTSWESFNTTKQLYLAGSTNSTEYSIYVKFENEAGESDVAYDSIIYLSLPLNPSIIINNGDASTNSTLVTLTLSADGAAEMCFRNGSNGIWTEWEAYATTKQLYLASSTNNTEYTICVKFKNIAGESEIVCDSIQYLIAGEEGEVDITIFVIIVIISSVSGAAVITVIIVIRVRKRRKTKSD